jgi:hypothetical protein
MAVNIPVLSDVGRRLVMGEHSCDHFRMSETPVFGFDTDKDGTADVVAYDTDGDGRVDKILMDTNKDGEFDVAQYDDDGDGQIDRIVKSAE